MENRRRFGREIRDLRQQMASGQGDPARQQERMQFLQGQQMRQRMQNAVGQSPGGANFQFNRNDVSNNALGRVGGPNVPNSNGLQGGGPGGTYNAPVADQTLSGQSGNAGYVPGQNGLNGMSATGPVGQAWGFNGPNYPQYPGLPSKTQPMPRPTLNGQQQAPWRPIAGAVGGQVPPGLPPQGLLSRPPTLRQPGPQIGAPDDTMSGQFRRY